ncbi:MAG: DUF1127 domain-containing protein [Boseongicola sp.]|nr:DUF1127 domain-containing protein [Boseongicola sp.]MDD9979023.1 DUF1127 domain-containing protein [Boseongicola sp.]
MFVQEALRSPMVASNRVHPLRWLVGAVLARKSRRDLAKLDAHLLEDIGVSMEAAKQESTQPVWNVPHHWMK